MPRYSFSLEDGTSIGHQEAVEDLPNDEAALQAASEIASDLTRSLTAAGKSRVIVKDEAGKVIGSAPLRTPR